jgi:predicted GTPase
VTAVTAPTVLVVGKPNAGKTLFVLNFAAFLGERALAVEALDSAGGVRRRRLSVERARHTLVSPTPHTTLEAEAVTVTLAVRRERRPVRLIDTAALLDDVADREEVRRAMATTLTWLEQTDVVLHLVDTVATAQGRPFGFGPVDRELSAYAGLLPGYMVLANKMDHADAPRGFRHLRAALPRGIPVIPVSCVTRQGFRQVLGALAKRLTSAPS